MTSAPFPRAAEPDRRTVMAAAGAAGLTAALTACGSDDSPSDPGSPADARNGPGAELARTSDIPEGGGKVFEDQGVVVTQPTAGDFKAFSSRCTHRGCAVKGVTDGVINCPCHQSNFSITDGSVRSGPATMPLPAQPISVDGDSIRLA